MQKTTRSLLPGLIAAAAFSVSVATPAIAQQKLKIGFISTFSGPQGVIGEDMKNSVELALDHLKRKVGGLDTEIFYGDDQVKPDVGKQVAEEMLKKNNVDFVAGVIWSNVMLAVEPTVVGAGKFMIGTNAGPNQLAGADCNELFFTTSWQNDFTLDKDHLLTAGFDYYVDEIDSTESFPVTSRDDKAGFLQYQGNIMGHSLDLSVRQDSNQQFGGKTTGGAAWGYGFGEALRLSASYGTAFKAPTFNDLYYPFFGNPHLQPESSQSVEVGAKGRLADVNWAVNGYYTKIDDLIAFDANTFLPQNIAKAEIFGMETQVSARFYGIDISANLSLVDPRNQEDGPNHGNVLPRRAQQMAQIELNRTFGKFRAGLIVNQEGRRYDDLANTVRLHGFTLLGIHASYEVYKDVTLEGRAANLFNEHYQTAYLYNQMGTNLFLSLNWRPSGSQ